MATIKLLFAHGGSIEHGQLLHYAVRRNINDRPKVAQLLIDKGAPINDVMYQNHPESYRQMQDFGIGTPLHEAAEEGKLDMVELLIAHGADPMIRDPKGELAIDKARRAGQSEVVQQLLRLTDSSS